MNCQSFENVLDDLVRGRLMDATEREDALAHESDCARCSARLADERALTAGLRTLAAQESTLEAPARVEAALLAAFRERRASAQGERHAFVAETKATQRQARAIVASPWWFSRWAQGAAVAAASMLVVFGLYGLASRSTQEPTGQRASQTNPSVISDSAKPETTTAQNSGNVLPGVPAKTDEDADENGPQQDEREGVPPRKQARRPSYQLANNSGGRVPTRNANYTEPEITTDYIPIMNGGRLTPGDAGHVVRVELPRSALASFGLPVNADRAEARVKADVLMGEDGMARAIRFVR